MKRTAFGFLILITLLYLGTTQLAAHPLDTTRTDLVMPVPEGWEPPADIGDWVDLDLSDLHTDSNKIQLSLFMPWSSAAYLINNDDLIASPSASALREYGDVYFAYIKEKLIIINESEQCVLDGLRIGDQTDEQVLLGSGMNIEGTFVCPNDLGGMLIHNSLFTHIFPLQTNVVNVYAGTPQILATGTLLTPQTQEFYVDHKNVVSGTVSIRKIEGEQTPRFTDEWQNRLGDLESLPLLGLIGITFVLGLLHTLEAGHSKSILTALVVDKGVSYKEGLAYASVFTITHVADIILMGLVLLFASSVIDVYEHLPYLQVAAAYGLILVALYMVLQNLGHLLQHWLFKHDHGHHHEHEHGHSHELKKGIPFRKQLMLGFVTGLAPCLFGWSIFMLILSSKQLWVAIPVILSFGLGIFVALLGFMWLLTHLRSRFLDKHSWIGVWSPLVSALLLLGVAVAQVV